MCQRDRGNFLFSIMYASVFFLGLCNRKTNKNKYNELATTNINSPLQRISFIINKKPVSFQALGDSRRKRTSWFGAFLVKSCLEADRILPRPQQDRLLLKTVIEASLLNKRKMLDPVSVSLFQSPSVVVSIKLTLLVCLLFCFLFIYLYFKK